MTKNVMRRDEKRHNCIKVSRFVVVGVAGLRRSGMGARYVRVVAGALL